MREYRGGPRAVYPSISLLSQLEWKREKKTRKGEGSVNGQSAQTDVNRLIHCEIFKLAMGDGKTRLRSGYRIWRRLSFHQSYYQVRDCDVMLVLNML